MLEVAQCFRCRHKHRPTMGDIRPRCEAFLDGIPTPIWDNAVRHTAPYPGDNGIMFEPKR